MHDIDTSLKRIRSLNDPEQRLGCLETYLLSRIRSSEEDLIPLSEVLSLAFASLAALQTVAASAEAAKSYRFIHDRLVRTLTAIWFHRHGLLRLSRATAEAGACHVKREATTTDRWELADEYRTLLTLASNWMLGRYIVESLHDRLRELPVDRRDEFQRQCDQLAVALRETYGGLSELSQCARLLTDIQDRRVLAQFHSSRRQSEVIIRVPEKLLPGVAQLISVNMSPTLQRSRELYGAVIFEADRYHLWYSSNWTDLVKSLTSLDISDELPQDALFEQIDMELSSPEWDRYSLQTIIRDDVPESRIKTVIASDLTGNPLPLDVLMDRSARYQWVAGGVPPGERRPLSGTGHVSFWGGIQISIKPSLDQPDDDARHVMNRDTGELLLAYPEIRQLDPLMGFPKPLPLTHFERWMLEDCCHVANIELVSHTGSCATRDSFITSSHIRTRILHVSTHGISNIKQCDYSYLLLAPDGDRPSIVHFTDILTIDASSFEVVFLNTCRTGAGSRHIGESALSLSWAFLAAGAQTTIASLWPVEDEVAFLFAKAFYERLLGSEEMSVSDAFHGARRALRDHPHCRRPCQWATFQLLSRPMNLISAGKRPQPSTTRTKQPQRGLRPFIPPHPQS